MDNKKDKFSVIALDEKQALIPAHLTKGTLHESLTPCAEYRVFFTHVILRVLR